eukprot:2091038-Amphidinium_carterae.2
MELALHHPGTQDHLMLLGRVIAASKPVSKQQESCSSCSLVAVEACWTSTLSKNQMQPKLKPGIG